jgi:hypothetical protein
MHFYKIKKASIENNILIGSVNGKNIPNGNNYFCKINNGEILSNAPIFDYFFLQSFEDKELWEIYLKDIHGGIGIFPLGNWLVSDKLKKLLEKYLLAKDYFFYESRLLYKGMKLTFWLFQFTAIYRKLNKTKYIDFEKSCFVSKKRSDKLVKLISYSDYLNYEYELKNKENDKILSKKISLKEHVDLITLVPIRPDIVISERLKTAMEENNIEGFEFSELDYEVVVEK